MENKSNNNILSLIDNNPDNIILSLAARVKERRLERTTLKKNLRRNY